MAYRTRSDGEIIVWWSATFYTVRDATLCGDLFTRRSCGFCLKLAIM